MATLPESLLSPVKDEVDSGGLPVGVHLPELPSRKDLLPSHVGGAAVHRGLPHSTAHAPPRAASDERASQ